MHGDFGIGRPKGAYVNQLVGDARYPLEDAKTDMGDQGI